MAGNPCDDAGVSYRYDHMGAEAFEKLAQRLVEAEPGPPVLAVVSFTSQPRRLYTDECLRVVTSALDRRRSEIQQVIRRGTRHLLVVTNYEYRGTATRIQGDLSQIAADLGLESLRVWWGEDVDTRFEFASLATRLEFVNILPAQEAETARELDKRLQTAQQRDDLHLANLALTHLPSEIFQMTHLRALF